MWFTGTVQAYKFIERKKLTRKSYVKWLCVRSRLNYPGWAYGEPLDGFEVSFWYYKNQKFKYGGVELEHPDIREGDILQCNGHVSTRTFKKQNGDRVWMLTLHAEADTGFTIVARAPDLVDDRLERQLEKTNKNAVGLPPLSGKIPDTIRPSDGYCLRPGTRAVEADGLQGPDGKDSGDSERTGGSPVSPVELVSERDHGPLTGEPSSGPFGGDPGAGGKGSFSYG